MYALRVYCPVDNDALDRISSGQMPNLDDGSALAAIIGIVRGDNPLGDFGIYKAVIELAPGLEIFTPGTEARPTLGQPGSGTASPTAVLTIYIPRTIADEALSHAIDAIVAAHPWEVPVIELSETSLVTRA